MDYTTPFAWFAFLISQIIAFEFKTQKSFVDLAREEEPFELDSLQIMMLTSRNKMESTRRGIFLSPTSHLRPQNKYGLPP
jgi:hypothetical protein